MALVPRFRRRVMGQGIIAALRESRNHNRFTRSFVPGPTDPDQETAFYFMTVAVPSIHLAGGYEQYRQVRVNMLEAYGYALLEKQPKLRRVIGIAREPASDSKADISEDLAMLEDVVWTDELKAKLAERRKAFNILTEGNFTERPAQRNEFPGVLVRHNPRNHSREMRRRMGQAARKASKKKT